MDTKGKNQIKADKMITTGAGLPQGVPVSYRPDLSLA
jgi:hypothetical protein